MKILSVVSVKMSFTYIFFGDRKSRFCFARSTVCLFDFVSRSKASRILQTARVKLCGQSTHLWATSDLIPHFEALRTPHPSRRQGLCSKSSHLVMTADFVPRSNGKGYVANLSICGPLLILLPTLKRSGGPSWQGLCSKSAYFWAIAHFVLHFVSRFSTPCGPELVTRGGPDAFQSGGVPCRKTLPKGVLVLRARVYAFAG